MALTERSLSRERKVPMALRALPGNQRNLVGQRLIDALENGKAQRASLLRPVPNAPDGTAQQATNRRRERPASEAQAAEGFREHCIQSEVVAATPSVHVGSCCDAEDMRDEVFLAMHAPYVTCTRAALKRRSSWAVDYTDLHSCGSQGRI